MPHAVAPLVALTIGDTAGIGPEIALHALQAPALQAAVRLVVLGPERWRPSHVPLADVSRPDALTAQQGHAWLATSDHGPIQVGAVQRAAGLESLAALRAGHELASAQQVGALVTGPVSKEALRLAGEAVEGQTELLGRWCAVQRFEMLVIAGRLRTMLCTRHMPLRQALLTVTTPLVLDRILLLDESLRGFGVPTPRLAVCGWNPHAGENGLLGSEDQDILAPAIAAARARGVCVDGPVSPDSVFRLAARGEWDGVVSLWHDQAFIAAKLLDPEGGVTVLCGLPYVRVSPVHGTAMDIAGKGLADPTNLVSAVLQAAAWARPAIPAARP